MTLPRNRFGATDMEITRVGFGAWAIGGAGWKYAWGEQDDDESVAALRHAVEAGVNWVDTAAVYGLGHSEEVVARALGDLPAADRPYVFTKCGLIWDPADPGAEPRRVGAPESVRRECEASLRRLGVECIDLYQVHWPADDVAVEDCWAVLLQLKAEGKVRAVGLSNHGVDQLAAAEKFGHVDSVQPPFSAIERTAAADIVPWARARETAVIGYSPMQAGLLTGTFTRRRAASLSADDWRSRSDHFRGEGLERNLALAAALIPVAERHGVSEGAVAVAWTLAWPGVTGAIVGARSPAQVDGWLPAAALELTGDDLDDIAEAIERSGAGDGPTRP